MSRGAKKGVVKGQGPGLLTCRLFPFHYEKRQVSTWRHFPAPLLLTPVVTCPFLSPTSMTFSCIFLVACILFL